MGETTSRTKFKRWFEKRKRKKGAFVSLNHVVLLDGRQANSIEQLRFQYWRSACGGVEAPQSSFSDSGQSRVSVILKSRNATFFVCNILTVAPVCLYDFLFATFEFTMSEADAWLRVLDCTKSRTVFPPRFKMSRLKQKLNTLLKEADFSLRCAFSSTCLEDSLRNTTLLLDQSSNFNYSCIALMDHFGPGDFWMHLLTKGNQMLLYKKIKKTCYTCLTVCLPPSKQKRRAALFYWEASKPVMILFHSASISLLHSRPLFLLHFAPPGFWPSSHTITQDLAAGKSTPFANTLRHKSVDRLQAFLQRDVTLVWCVLSLCV